MAGRRLARDIGWGFKSRADFESVVRIEFSSDLADAFLDEHEGTEVDYAVVSRPPLLILRSLGMSRQGLSVSVA